MQDDLIYYKQRTVQISAKDPSGVLPQEQSLRASLASFGDLWHFQSFCTRDQGDSSGQPNTAIIVFRNQASVKNTLDSSRNESGESFWRTDSVKAHTLKKTGALYEAFLMQIVPTLRQESRVPSSGSDGPLCVSESQAGPPSLEDSGPPLKRPRSEDWGTTPNGSISNNNHVSTPKSSQTSSATLESTEWMRTRITQLEAELDAAKASRDISISEQDVIRVAYEAEQQARREAMSQKCAAEAALSRGEVEQDRLRTLLDALRSEVSAQSNVVGGLSRPAVAVDEEILTATQSCLEVCTECHEYIKTLNQELEEPQGQEQDPDIQRSNMEEQKAKLGTTKLGDPRATIRQLESDIEQLKSDLVSTQERLESTQRSLESLEQRHSSTLEEYESTKERMEVCRLQLENEQMLMQKLKGTLIPEVYKSLGATNETLGAFLSAMGLPPTSRQGTAQSTEESN